jgi:AraC-like DNA-binding protein
MLKEGYELYYYSDVAFEPVEPHKHDFYEIYVLLDGKDVTLEAGGERLPLERCSLAIIPPGITHRSAPGDKKGPYRRLVFWIKRPLVKNLSDKYPSCAYLFRDSERKGRYVFALSEGGFRAIESKALRLIEEGSSARYGKDDIEGVALADLLLTMARAVREAGDEGAKRADESILSLLLRYIDGHIGEELTLDTLASRFYVSKYYVAHLFKDSLGVSAHRYIEKKRLSYCREAILAGAPITKVCHAYGFKDYSSFYRAFRKEYGCPPKSIMKGLGPKDMRQARNPED